MDRRAARHNRKVRYGFNPFVAFGSSEEAAMEDILKLMMSTDPNADGRKIRSRVTPALKAGCVGPADKIREQMLRFHNLGIELLLLKFVPSLEEIARIRDEIIDPLRHASSRPAPLKAAG
jgi:alkanesulfonate monooxygenase SsuD/methylene tetrahydromethanopterin reductase-like flavin-dependent oxidoreductase (luciferase family)